LQNIIRKDTKFIYLFYGIAILLSVLCVLSLFFEYYKTSLLIFAIPLLIFVYIKFADYFKYFFIGSLFVGGYYQWPLRVQLSLLVTFSIIFFFLTNKDTLIFNELILPKSIKYSASAIIFAVYISSILTPFISFYSLYYATLFFVFAFSSYVIFRSVKSCEEVDKLLYFFAKIASIAGLIIILQILITGNLRSVGITQFAVIDFVAFAFVTVLFRNFLLSKIDRYSLIISIIVLIVLITTQSRFAWLGFLLTSIYGLVVSYIYSDDARIILKKRFPIFIIAVILAIALFFIFGLEKIITSRIGNVSLSLFQNADDKLVSNSLESRVFIWIIALNTFIHNPITGVGYLMFSEISENYNILPEFVFNLFVKDLDAHTTYLNFLCETGVVGLVSFLIYVITIFRYSLKSIKLSKNFEETKVSILLNLLVFFIMVHSIYSGAFTMGQNAFHMHLIFGLSIANYVLLKNKDKSTHNKRPNLFGN